MASSGRHREGRWHLLYRPSLSLRGRHQAGQRGSRIFSATGRYTFFTIIGLVIATGALSAAALIIATSRPLIIFEITLFVLGAGLGLVMPNLTVALQNAVAQQDLGVATSASSFMRSLGGSFGVALAGAIVAGRLADSPLGAAAERIQQLINLPPSAHEAISAAFRQASVETFSVGIVMWLWPARLFCFSRRGRSDQINCEQRRSTWA